MDFTALDALINDLFKQEFFTIAFGILLWFSLQWSMDRGKGWSFKKWFHDQLDEIFVVTLVGFALVSFDDVAVRQLQSHFEGIQEPGRVIYLLSGPITLAIMKLIQKFRRNDTNKPPGNS